MNSYEPNAFIERMSFRENSDKEMNCHTMCSVWCVLAISTKASVYLIYIYVKYDSKKSEKRSWESKESNDRSLERLERILVCNQTMVLLFICQKTVFRIPKVKTVKNQSLYLHQCTFTIVTDKSMNRPEG